MLRHQRQRRRNAIEFEEVMGIEVVMMVKCILFLEGV